jgi:Fe-S oxidoreductase
MTRIDGNRVKAEQLFAAKARGAKTLIAPCHNCHSGLEDINHYYGIGQEIKFIGDILYEAMEKPEVEEGEKE